MKKTIIFFLIFTTSVIYSQGNCDIYKNFNCADSLDDSVNYFFEIKIEKCEEFKFNSNVDKDLKEGLINKIITRVDLSSSVEISNIDGKSSSSFKERTSLESSGILFDINYLYCKRGNSNYLIAYIDKNVFNNSSRRSFQSQLISLNSSIDLIFDQLIFNDELTFENDINKINQEVLFMDKNLLFLNNINIEYDLVYAFENLKSKLEKLKSRLRTFENMKNEVLNFLLNANKERAKAEFELMQIKFGKNTKYKKDLQDLKKIIRRGN